ncbi:hypothetical protein AAFF_G00186420 [Aldrovandia affinis]|uniref:Uncharacterized protein n=1 Tax=Aldrovandia affinis TaxID=143900 RepID=A0AAD7WVN1_9TELE|nr:hypothetical protein AAFF_G00186420 [Aldrovandia affinis]
MPAATIPAPQRKLFDRRGSPAIQVCPGAESPPSERAQRGAEDCPDLLPPSAAALIRNRTGSLCPKTQTGNIADGAATAPKDGTNRGSTKGQGDRVCRRAPANLRAHREDRSARSAGEGQRSPRVDVDVGEARGPLPKCPCRSRGCSNEPSGPLGRRRAEGRRAHVAGAAEAVSSAAQRAENSSRSPFITLADVCRYRAPLPGLLASHIHPPTGPRTKPGGCSHGTPRNPPRPHRTATPQSGSRAHDRERVYRNHANRNFSNPLPTAGRTGTA